MSSPDVPRESLDHHRSSSSPLPEDHKEESKQFEKEQEGDTERESKRRRIDSKSATPPPQTYSPKDTLSNPDPSGQDSRISETLPSLLPEAVPVPEPTEVFNVGLAATAGPINAAESAVGDFIIADEEETKATEIDAAGIPPPPPEYGITRSLDEDFEMEDGSFQSGALDQAVSTPAPICTAASSPVKEDTPSSGKGQPTAAVKTQAGKGKKTTVNAIKKNVGTLASGKKGKGKTKVEELKGNGNKARSSSADSRSATPPASTSNLFTSPSGALVETNAAYCICRRPYDDDEDEGLMVGCESCDGWFHASCIGLDEEAVELLDVYICRSCERSTHQRTIYKTVCKREGCRKSVAGSNSKFCSSQCAFLHSQTILSTVTNKAGLKHLHRALASYPSPNLGVSVTHHKEHIVEEPSTFALYDEPEKQISYLQTQIDAAQRSITITLKRQALLNAAIEKFESLPLLNGAGADGGAEDAQQQQKSSKSKRKPSRPTEDKSCGWDPVLQSDDAEVELLVREGEGDAMEVVGRTGDICMMGKKKCDRHQGWQKTLVFSLDVELASYTRTYNALVENQQRIEEAGHISKLSDEAREMFSAKRQTVKPKV